MTTRPRKLALAAQKTAANVSMVDGESTQFRFLRRTPAQARASKTILGILRACEALLGEYQDSEITIDMIADKADVQAGSVYFFFKDKVHIFFCLIDYSLRELAQQFSFTSAETALPLTSFLRQLENRLIRLWADRKRMMNLYFAYRAHPSLKPTVVETNEIMEAAMASALGHYFPSTSTKRRHALAVVVNSHLTMGLDVAAAQPTARVAEFRSEWRQILYRHLDTLEK